MGEVFTARDTRLNRLVAIKVSHEQFTARFEREARAAAALNHPNICQIYDVGPNYLVMERVEGAQLHSIGDVQQLLNVGMQIADALAAAHSAGIVHRDLKPSNIVITASGLVKVLDFGLAKMADPADSSLDQTHTVDQTRAGAVVGTPAYMSPEQARGEHVDARSDLWSFGVVLYEMATGHRPFDGSTAAVIFEALLGKAPIPARERDPKIPPELDRVIGRLLEKDRETRYQSAADVRADLRRIARGTDALAAVSSSQPGAATRRMGGPWTIATATVLAALAIAAALWMNRQSERPVTSPSDYVQLTNFADSVVDPSLSPDGRMVTFIRGDSNAFPRYGDVWVKLLPDGEAVRLTNTPSRKYAPVFTPAGSRVAYTQREANEGQGQGSWDTWTVPISGGEPTRLLPNAAGLLWIDNQHVLFAEIKTGLHMGIVTASAGRADKREIYFPGHERAMAHYAYLSPDRQDLLIVEMDRAQIFLPCRLMPFDGRSPGRQVGPPGSCTAAAWSPDGRWMYFIAAVNDTPQLWRQRYPDGPPERMTSGLTDTVGLAVAPDGRSIVTAFGAQRSAVWIHDERGDRQVTTEGVAFAPQLSQDGGRLYYLLRPNALDAFTELRSLELSSGKTDRLLPDQSVTQYVVSRDEREVAFTTMTAAGSREIWLAALDRSMPPRRVVQSADDVSFGAGDDLIFRSLEDKVNFLMRIGKDGSGLRRIIQTPILNKFGVSPNGAWTAVLAPGQGDATYVTLAVPLRGGDAYTICNGCAVHWSPDGTRLYVGTEGPASPSFLVVPIDATQAPPKTLMTIIATARKGVRPPGIEFIERLQIAPSANPSIYAFTRRDVQRNLFRIPLR